MAIYSISDLEKLSGVKAHTIRIWEKRYNLLAPKRTESNIRYYVEKDLKRLLNITLLNRNGLKISKIARMDPEEIRDAVLELSQEDSVDTEVLSDTLTLAMLEMDEDKFNAAVQGNISDIGFKRTMVEIIFPFLNRLSILWMTGSVSPVQENYVAGLIRQKIFVAIEALQNPTSKDSFLLFLPEGERQELSMLFIHYILKEAGYRVINLGAQVSLEDLKFANEIQQPKFLLTMVNETLGQMSIQDYVDELSLHFRDSTILLTGLQLARRQMRSRANCRVFNDLDELQQFLNGQALQTT